MPSELHNQAATLAKNGQNAEASLALFQAIQKTQNPLLREQELLYFKALQKALGVPNSAIEGFPNHLSVLLSTEVLLVLFLIPLWGLALCAYLKIRKAKQVVFGVSLSLFFFAIATSLWFIRAEYSNWAFLWAEEEIPIFETQQLKNKTVSLAKGTLILAKRQKEHGSTPVQIISPITGWAAKEDVRFIAEDVSPESRSLGSH